MSEKYELKNCPFCGGKAKMLTYRTGEDSMGAHVECTVCYVSTQASDDAYADTASVAAIWNRRVDPSGNAT